MRYSKPVAQIQFIVTALRPKFRCSPVNEAAAVHGLVSLIMIIWTTTEAKTDIFPFLAILGIKFPPPPPLKPNCPTPLPKLTPAVYKLTHPLRWVPPPAG